MKVLPKNKEVRKSNLTKVERICFIVAIAVSGLSVYYFFIKLVFL